MHVHCVLSIMEDIQQIEMQLSWMMVDGTLPPPVSMYFSGEQRSFKEYSMWTSWPDLDVPPRSNECNLHLLSTFGGSRSCN